MSALTGIWRFDNGSDTLRQCRLMLATQAQYGPDDVATWHAGKIAIGRCLMRTLPEDKFDRQPLLGADGQLAVVADVRLDNRDELAAKLNLSTDRTAQMCDADIVLVAWERWAERAVDHLIGDFAFVVWDGRRRRLWLARDPMGRRPLHYHLAAGFFAFASMPKGLHALTEVPCEADEERIIEHLLAIPQKGTRTYFRGIERVEPGHVIEVAGPHLTARRYWQPKTDPIRLRSREDYAEAMLGHIDQAVRCRLRGIRHVAAHLSGGLDSSAVATSAALQLASSGGQVTAFTSAPRIDYDDIAPRYRIADESDYASQTARLHPNMEHVVVRSTGRSPLDDLDRNFDLLQLPATNLANNGWIYDIADAAKSRDVGVLLSGDMGNVGFSYHGMTLLPQLLAEGRLSRWHQEASAIVRLKRMRWRGVVATSVGPWTPGLLWTGLQRLVHGRATKRDDFSPINPALLDQSAFQARTAEAGLDRYSRPSKDGLAERLLILSDPDCGNLMKGMLGGWRIDMRDPTADVRLLDFCLRVPLEQYLSEGVPRSLARRALVGRVAPAVLDEQRRGIQAADWHKTLSAARGRLNEELGLIAACPTARRLLDIDRFRRLIDDWPNGGWEQDDVAVPYEHVLLNGISVGHFLRRLEMSKDQAAHQPADI